MELFYCVVVFARSLRRERLETKFIDLFQGILPNSMFVKYYYGPDLASTFESPIRLKNYMD